MNESTLNRMIREHKEHVIWVAVFLILAVFVTALTFGTLKKSVQAKTYTKREFQCPYAQEGAEPVAHKHNDDCYENGVLICTLPERELHTHTDECYREEKVLVCGQEEGEGHVHDESCYTEETVNVCGLEESEGHYHDESCYDEEGNLICTRPEGEGHTHTDECFETRRVLSCGKEEGEGAHTHTDACYEIQKVLICDKEEVTTEHVHTADCFKVVDMSPEEIRAKTMSELPESDMTADVESAADWESRFSSVTLSGDWDKDLLKIAETQLGYTESQRNFDVVPDEEGEGYTIKGYTRYGDWYGIPYGDWCAMFISFCLNYADIPETAIPYDCATTTWIKSLSERGMYADASDYTPKPGDLIFFDWEGDKLSDHVGIVWAVNPNSITTIEGNHTASVEFFDYDRDDGHIQGYGILPKNPDAPAADEDAEPSDEITAGNTIINIDETAASAADSGETAVSNADGAGAESSVPAEAETGVSMPEFHYSERVAGMRVTIDADEGAFPEGTTVQITAIQDDSLAEQVAPAVTTGHVVEVQAVDITFYDAEGNEIEPHIPIRVTMRPFTETADADNVEVVHMDNDGTVSAVKTDESIKQPDKGAAFDADSFSKYILVYTADFEYKVNGKVYTFSVPGAQDTALSAILTGLNIVDQTEISEFMGKIKDVTVSNPEVLKLTAAEGDWMICPVKDSERQEFLTISMKDGAVFAVSFEAHGITEISTEDETAVISTVNDFYLPDDASAYVEALPKQESEASIAAVKETSAAKPLFIIDEATNEKTAYQVFNIGLENVEAGDYQDGFKVEVKIDEDMNLEGKDFHIYQVQDGNTTDLTETLELNGDQNESGLQNLQSFSFTTNEFANFVLSYTMETQYTTFDGVTYKVTMNYGSDAGLPEGSELKVREILPEEEEFAQYYAEATKAVSGEESSEELTGAEYARFFDIEIWVDDQKVEPKAAVSVRIELEDAPNSELKVVHFDEDGPVVLNTEKQTSTDISFETDSFSIYAVLTNSGNPTDLTNLDGRTFTLSRDNGYYVTADVIGRQYNKSNNQADVATWVFETAGAAYSGWGVYNIYTYVDGAKKYMNLVSDNSGDSQAWAVLSDDPQAFTVQKDGNSNKYYFETESNGKKYYLNEFGGSGTGFAGWQSRNSGDDLFNINLFTPASVQRETETYAVIIKNPANDKYYAVQHDGSLLEVSYSVENNTAGVLLENPLLWTYTSVHDGLEDAVEDGKHVLNNNGVAHSDWEPFNLRAAADARNFDWNQLPKSYYYRYISPQKENGIDEENSDNDNWNHNDSKWYNALKYENNTIYSTTWNGTQNVCNGHYIGADFENLHITGNQDSEHAATVYLAKLENPRTVGSRNETVSHIDIGIIGDAELEIPLAYGVYYYDNNGTWETLDTSDGTNVTLDLKQEVRITKKDMMDATITARDKNGNLLDDAFYITGYSANEHTSTSAVQVRMEGSFKVTTLDPYTGRDDPNKNPDWRTARLNNQVYYQVTTTKDITFDWKYNGHQLCDEDENPLSITVPMSFSVNFSYWDSANECPPILPYPHYFETDYFGGDNAGHNYDCWIRGEIIDGQTEYHWADSGMDFVIGAKEARVDNSVAVEIIKILEDEDGNVIHPASTVTNSFAIYGKSGNIEGDLNSVHNLAVTRANAVSSDSLISLYSGYDLVDNKTIAVGESGYGVTYDYIDPGMYYITEDSSPMETSGANRVIMDKEGKDWSYVNTRVETEYVWRDNGYNNQRHVANGYSGVPEVLGAYKDDKQIDQNNKFLQFYVYNVYKQVGALKLRKLVEVAGQTPTEDNKDLVDGAYDFSVTGPAGSDSPITKYVRIVIKNGQMDNYDIVDDAIDLFGKDGWSSFEPGEEDRWVLIDDLAAGDYVIRELGAYKCVYDDPECGIRATEPLEGVSLLSISGGKDDANLTERTITVTVANGDEWGDSASAKATFVNGTTYTSVPFKAKKTFEQQQLTENQFQFSLVEYQNASFDSVKANGVNQVVSNSAPAAGNNYADVEFEDLKITKPGTYYFLISEVVSGNTNIVYDTHQQKVIVTVTAGSNGALSYTKSYDPEFTEEGYDASFVNKIVSLSLKKITEASANNPVNGDITFTDGSYTFKLTGPAPSENSRTVVIAVKDGEMTGATIGGTEINAEGTEVIFDSVNGVRFYNLAPGEYTLTEERWSLSKTLPANSDMYLKNIVVTPAEGNSVNTTDKSATFTISGGTGTGSTSVAVDYTNIVEPNNPVLEKQVSNLNDSVEVPAETFRSESPWNKSADYDIGDEVPYRITTNLPSGYYRSLESYTYIISDEMNHLQYVGGSGKMYAYVKSDSDSDTGAWYDVSDWFSVTEGTYAEGKQIISVSPTDSNDLKKIVTGKLVTNWEGADTHGDDYPYKVPSLADATPITNDDIRYLQFRYKAVLQADANIGPAVGNTNTAVLTYSNGPSTATSNEDTNVVYTYKLIVNKTDGTNPLSGAEFQLFKKYKTDGDSDTINLQGLKDGVTVDTSRIIASNSGMRGNYRLVNAISASADDATQFAWNGLDDGNYILVETKAPDRYNPLPEPVAFTISTGLKTDEPGFITSQAIVNVFPEGALTFDKDLAGSGTITTAVPNRLTQVVDVPVEKTWANNDYDDANNDYTWTATFILTQKEELVPGSTAVTNYIKDWTPVSPEKKLTVTKGATEDAVKFKNLPQFHEYGANSIYKVLYSVKEVAYEVKQGETVIAKWDERNGLTVGDHRYVPQVTHAAGEPIETQSGESQPTDTQIYTITLQNKVENFTPSGENIDVTLKKNWDSAEFPNGSLPNDASATFSLKRYYQEGYREYTDNYDSSVDYTVRVGNYNTGSYTVTDSLIVKKGTNIHFTATFETEDTGKGTVIFKTGNGGDEKKFSKQNDERLATPKTVVFGTYEVLADVDFVVEGLNCVRDCGIIDFTTNGEWIPDTAFHRDITVSNNNNWQETISNLPSKATDNSGTERIYSYYFEEIESNPAGCYSTYVQDGTNDPLGDVSHRITNEAIIKATNKHRTTFKVTKEWLDLLGTDLPSYPEVYFTLYWMREGETSTNNMYVYRPGGPNDNTFVDIPLNKDNDWTWVCPVQLPEKYDDSHDAVFFAVETPKVAQSPGNYSNVIKTDPDYDTIGSNIVITLDGYRSKDKAGEGPWKQEAENTTGSNGIVTEARVLPTQPYYAAVGNSGEIQIRNKTLKYMQMDLKKKFLVYARNATDNGFDLLTLTSDSTAKHDLVIEIRIMRRTLEYNAPSDIPSSDSRVLVDWTQYGKNILIGYNHEGTAVFKNGDENGDNPFQIRYAGDWHWTIDDSNQNQGLPAYGIHDGQRVRYQYFLEELNAYQDLQKNPLEPTHPFYGFEWSNILPAAWDGNGTQVEMFPKIVAQDQDRLVNLQTTDLTITKTWNGTKPSDVQEVYVKVLRRTGREGVAGDPEDFTNKLQISEEHALGQIVDGYVSASQIRTVNGEKYLVIPANGGSVTINHVLTVNPFYDGGQDRVYYFSVQECGYKDASGEHWSTSDVEQFNPQYSFSDSLGQTAGSTMFVLGKTGTNTFTITNSPPATIDINIVKVEKDTNIELSGAVFSIAKKNTQSGSYETMTNLIFEPNNVFDSTEHTFTVPKDGVKLKGLDAGSYKLTEIASPAGYLITSNNSPLFFDVDNRGNVTISSESTEKGTTIVYDATTQTFTVPNTPGQELPETGGAGIGLFALIGGLMVGTAGAALLLRKKKNKA